MIRTVSRKGLRFIGTLNALANDGARTSVWLPATEQASSRREAAIMHRPAIAVLPFTNMSDDPEQEFFSDGISEDLITALSKLRWFFVIARNSSFIYKGKAVHLKQVGEELGVGYVVEGSVRKSGDRVRITVQLNDVANGSHVWAERYDRDTRDVSRCKTRSPRRSSPSWSPSFMRLKISMLAASTRAAWTPGNW